MEILSGIRKLEKRQHMSYVQLRRVCYLCVMRKVFVHTMIATERERHVRTMFHNDGSIYISMYIALIVINRAEVRAMHRNNLKMKQISSI